MITKSDILILLDEQSEKGVNIDRYLQELYQTTSIPISVIKFLNDNRSFDVAQFYEKIRRSYNKKKSDLYINIVKELDNVEDVLTTLSSYVLQANIFAKKLDDDAKEMFYRSSRLEEVTGVLNNYYKTYDIDKCIRLLSLLKADIKLFEGLKEDKQ